MPRQEEVRCVVLPANWATLDSRSTNRLQREIIDILPIVQEVFIKHSGNPNIKIEITGGQEWGHSFYSLHHSGFAVDIRTKNLAGNIPNDIKAELTTRLGANYDVILHEGGSPHLHIEYDLGCKVSNPIDRNWPADNRGVKSSHKMS